MPRPAIYNDKSIAANRKSGTKNCYVYLPAEDLSVALDKSHVVVKRKSGMLNIEVKHAEVVPGRSRRQVLVIKLKEVPKSRSSAKSGGYGDTEEIEVTVTDPDTGTVITADAEVVYHEETRRRRTPLAPKRKIAKRSRG